MLKIRNLLAIGIAVFMLAAVMIPFVSAQPALQTTETPTATSTVAVTSTTEATSTPLATVAATSTLSAATVTPLATTGATPVGTPSTLPRTGGSDDGSLLVSLALLVLAAVMVLGGLGLALSRRTR